MPDPATFTTSTNISQVTDDVEKISGFDGSYDAFAITDESLTADGWIEGTIDNPTDVFIFGLCSNASNYVNYVASFWIASGVCEIRESGTYRTDFAVVAGSVLRIEWTGSQVKYYKNGVIQRTITMSLSLPIKFGVLMNTLNGMLLNTKLHNNVAASAALLSASISVTIVFDNIEMAETGNALIAPFSRETWRDHFDSRGWRTIRDKLVAGFPYFVQPVPEDGYYEEIIDYGVVLNNVIVNLDWSTKPIDGTVTVTSEISSSTDGSSWTSPAVGASVFISSFRYLKIRVLFEGVS